MRTRPPSRSEHHHVEEENEVGHVMADRVHREEGIVLDDRLVAKLGQSLGQQRRQGNVVVDYRIVISSV